MDRNPAWFYKTLVVGVIVLFLLSGFPVIPCLSAPNNTSKCGWVPPNNQPPEPPTIDGPTECPPGVELCWTFQSIDPDDDDVMYIIDWGDGTFEETNYIQHDIPVEVCHTYEEKETYLLRARAIDIYGYEGEWSYYHIPINDDDCNLCPKVSKQDIGNTRKTICDVLGIFLLRLIIKDVMLANFIDNVEDTNPILCLISTTFVSIIFIRLLFIAYISIKFFSCDDYWVNPYLQSYTL